MCDQVTNCMCVTIAKKIENEKHRILELKTLYIFIFKVKVELVKEKHNELQK